MLSGKTIFYIGLTALLLLINTFVKGQGITIPSSAYVIANNGNFITYSNFTNNGSFTHTGGTVIFGGTTVVSGTTTTNTFNNLTVASSSTGTYSSGMVGLVVTGTLTTGTGGILDLGTNTVLSGTLSTINNSGTIKTSVLTTTSAIPIPTGKTWGGTIDYTNASGGQTVVPGTYFDLIVRPGAANTTTAGGNLVVNDTLSVTAASGTLDLSTYTLSGTLSGTKNSGIIKTSSASATPLPSGITWGGTIDYAKTNSQTVVGGTYNNLTVRPGNAWSTTATGNLVVNGTLTITTAFGHFDMSTYVLSGTLTSISNSGDLKTSVPTATSAIPIPTGKTWGGTVYYNALAGAQTVVAGSYNILALSNTSGSNIVAGDITVTNQFKTTAGGVLDMGSSYRLINGGTITNDGTVKTSVLTATSATPLPASKTWGGIGTVEYAALTGSQTVVGGTYNILKLSNTSGTNSASGLITVNNQFTTLSGSTLDMGSANRLITAGTIVSNGTIKTSVTTATSALPISAGKTWGGTVEYAAATGAQTVVDGTYNNLTCSNTSGSNTAAAAMNVNGILYVNSGGTFNSAGYVTLVSNSTQTALIDGSGGGTVSGNVTMQRYLIAGHGYKYFSSPFTAATVSNFSSTVNLASTFPSFYNYIENQANYGFATDTIKTNVLSPMVGYAANFGSASATKTISIIGVVNNGALSSTLYNHNQPYTLGFNLVGNPYPSPVDWNASSGWTKTNIDNAVYYFDSDSTSQYTGVYNTYINGVSSDGIANNIIPSMQGFFVHVTNGTYPVTGTLAVNNNVRVNNLTPVFHRSAFNSLLPVARTLVRLSASFSDNLASSDPLVVYVDDRATLAFNREFDAIKLMNTNEQIPNIYSMGIDASKLVINALPKVDTSTVIPLGLQTSKDGVVTFNLRNLEQWPYNIHLYLVDNEMGTSHDLQQNPKFSVSLKQGTYENRFSLRCTPLSVASGKTNVNNDIYTVYNSGRNLFVHIKLVNDQKGDLIISNMQGTLISRKAINGNGDYTLDGRMGEAIYVVSFITANATYSKKIFLGSK